MPGVELRIFRPDRQGIGEIIARTPSLMKEYFRNPRATDEVIKEGLVPHRRPRLGGRGRLHLHHRPD